ncbi:MAG: stage II sporulation protein P, partial [Bacillota bacterium]
MKKYKVKKGKLIALTALKIVLFIIAAVFAIKAGTIGGDILSKSDKKIIGSVDVEVYRFTLNNSLPIIDTIYNSGNISMSLSGQIRGLVKDFFHFDLSSPITVLNAQSPYFYSYYVGSYKKLVAQNNRSNEPYFYIADINTPDSENPKPTNPGEGDPKPVYTPRASSISYNVEEDERRSDPEKNAVTYDKIAINSHEIKYSIDIGTLMEEPLKLKFDKKGPKVLIYHTHTNESFIRDLSQLKKDGVPNRTNDTRYNVVRVGEELTQILRKKYNIDVIHNATMHNYPKDIGAYGRSLNTASSILKSYPSIKIVLDIHRDGIKDGKLRVVSKVNNKDAAKIMFVVGTDTTGLKHPNWRENLKLAIKLQQKLNEKYPGLARPIYISHNRY